MKRLQVIRTHTSPYQSRDFLQRERALIESFPTLVYETIESEAREDVILVTNTHTELRNLPQRLLKKTKLIIHPNSGYDNFAQDVELWKNIPLIVGHVIRAQAVAEYSIGALFEGLLELPQHLSWHKERTWERTLLKGKEVWVFGYGHIGKVIADTLAALGMKVVVVDPFVRSCPHLRIKTWKEGSIENANVLIAATSLNPTSKHLFNEELFSRVRKDILFINGARGKLVDEKALKEFLLTSPEAFAFLDVFENEPFGEEWHGFPQVWKTSHIAGVEKDLDQKILDFERDVLRDYLNLEEKDFLGKYERELLQNKRIKGVLI
jgi:D-3-phosphoglycerate dehydrogenase